MHRILARQRIDGLETLQRFQGYLGLKSGAVPDPFLAYGVPLSSHPLLLLNQWSDFWGPLYTAWFP